MQRYLSSRRCAPPPNALPGQVRSPFPRNTAGPNGQPDNTYPGLQASESSIEWLWDSCFAAVVADLPGFEVWNSGLESGSGFRMHEILFSGLSLPIGELSSLRELAGQCERLGRWTVFLTSQVLNVPGGVASPTNAIAIL